MREGGGSAHSSEGWGAGGSSATIEGGEEAAGGRGVGGNSAGGSGGREGDSSTALELGQGVGRSAVLEGGKALGMADNNYA